MTVAPDTRGALGRSSSRQRPPQASLTDLQPPAPEVSSVPTRDTGSGGWVPASCTLGRGTLSRTVSLVPQLGEPGGGGG